MICRPSPDVNTIRAPSPQARPVGKRQPQQHGGVAAMSAFQGPCGEQFAAIGYKPQAARAWVRTIDKESTQYLQMHMQHHGCAIVDLY